MMNPIRKLNHWLFIAATMVFAGVSCELMWAFELQGIEIEAGTEAPLMAGARLKVQLPSSMHLRAGVGFVPEFYSDTYSSLSGSIGIHGQNTADSLASALAGSVALDLRAAYSLDPDGGFYAEVGYMFFSGGSGTVSGNVAEDAQDVEYSFLDDTDDITIEGSFHAVSLHIGYLFLLTERVSLNADVGLVKPIFGTISISAPSLDADDEAELAGDFEPYLEDAIVAEMLIPTASIYLAYLF